MQPMHRPKLAVVRSTPSPPEAQSPPPREPSGQGSPEIAVEKLAEAAHELPPLFARYWREGGDQTIPLDPDWQGLLMQEAMDRLLFLAARHEGTLVGFAITLFFPHVAHKGSLHAQTAWLYVEPAYRVGSFALRFVKHNLALVKMRKPVRAFIATPDERLAKLYERAGYEFHEAVYAKVF